MNDFIDWVNAREIVYNRPYTYTQWATDVLQAVADGKPMDARLIVEARRILDSKYNLRGLKDLLHALNNVAHSKMVAEDKVVEKYTTRYTVIDFRLRGWHETQRVREAHLLHWQDVQETLGELRRAG